MGLAVISSKDGETANSLRVGTHRHTPTRTERAEEIRVLLIDDDEDDFVIISDLLDKISHQRYVLTWQNTYTGGLTALMSREHDVCLLDYQIDELNGIDLLTNASANGCDTPIVILSGWVERELESAAIRGGATDCVMKGRIGPDALERILRHAIEHAESSRRIKEAEANRNALVAGIPDTVLRIARSGEILAYHPGSTSDPADGPVGTDSTIRGVLGIRAATAVMASVEKALMSGGAASCEFTKEGVFVTSVFEARVVAVGDVSEAVAIIRDLTNERAAAQRLNELLSAKDQFLAKISHDLRTPLASVLGFTVLLVDEWEEFTTPERIEMIATISEAASELGELFEDLLVMARAEIETLVFTRERVDLVFSASRAARIMTNADVVVDFVGQDEPAYALLDQMRLDQILRHLLSNAVLHGGERREIDAGRCDAVAWIEVRDNGEGVPSSERLWENKASHDSPSTFSNSMPVGIGLSVSRKLARKMVGDLTYRHDSGWTTFRLEFPLAQQQDDHGGGRESDAEVPSATPGMPGEGGRARDGTLK